MPHKNVKDWDGNGERPCDWCGHLLLCDKYIHHNAECNECGRKCSEEERRFYIELGYDGYSDVKPPMGYEILIPKSSHAYSRSTRSYESKVIGGLTTIVGELVIIIVLLIIIGVSK